MNGLSYLLSTLGTRQQPLKVHHSRASGSDAVEMSPDFSRVTSAHNIYSLSKWYLQSIYKISTQQRTAEFDCVPGPSAVCGDGEAPPGLGSLLTVCRLRAQTLDIYTLSTISTISTQDRRRKGSSPRTAAPHSSSNFSMKFNFSSEMWRRFHWVVVNTFSLFFLAPSQECCLLRYFLWRDKLIRII